MTSPYHRAPLTPSQRWQQFRRSGGLPLTLVVLLSAHIWLSVSSLILLTPNAASSGLFYLHPLLSWTPTPVTLALGLLTITVAGAVLLRAKRYTWQDRTRDPQRAYLAALWSRAALRVAICGLVVCAAPVVGFVALWVAVPYWWGRMIFEVREWLGRRGGYGLERRAQATRWLRTWYAIKRLTVLLLGTGWLVVNLPANIGAIAALLNHGVAEQWDAVPVEVWVRVVLLTGIGGLVGVGWVDFADDVAGEGSAL